MEPSAGTNRRRTRLLVGAGTGVALAAALVYIGLVDPHLPGSLFPPCPFKLLTGWNCPACGGLRMMHDLLHGDIAAAVVDNVFLLIGLPLLALWVFTRRRRDRPVVTPAAMVTLCVVTIAWTIVRNLPGFPLIPTLLNG